MAGVESVFGAVTSREADGTPVIALRGELDVLSAATVYETLESILAASRPKADLGTKQPVVIDMSELHFMDSSGLAVLLGAVNRGCSLRLRQPSTIIRDLITATGLGDVLPVESPTGTPASASYPNDPASVADARAFVAAALRDIRDETRNRAVLITSELATNAVQHARSPFSVAVSFDAERIRIAVTDEGGTVPTPRNPDRTETAGRGLLILRALSDDWGIETTPGHTTVWFALTR